MKHIVQKSLQDIFSGDVIFFVLKIGLASIFLSSVLLWFLWGGLSTFIASYLSWIPWSWLQTTGSKIITFGLGYMILIITASLLTSLYSEKLLLKLAKKHYPDVETIGGVNVATSIITTLKSSLFFLLLFVLCIPFLFIPVIGQVIMVYLWSILIKEPTTYDVGYLFTKDKKEIKKRVKKGRVLSMIASLLNYVPILNLFTPIFAQILFLHHFLEKKN